MSQTASIPRRPIVADTNELGSQAAGVGLEADVIRSNPITPALTQGQPIMPHLNNETIKCVLR